MLTFFQEHRKPFVLVRKQKGFISAPKEMEGPLCCLNSSSHVFRCAGAFCSKEEREETKWEISLLFVPSAFLEGKGGYGGGLYSQS